MIRIIQAISITLGSYIYSSIRPCIYSKVSWMCSGVNARSRSVEDGGNSLNKESS
jgi:hypothetical protein